MSKIKGSAIAPSNIAFSKYWGKQSDELTLPMNDSISMTLDGVFTHTTVEFSDELAQDEVNIGDIYTPISAVAGSKKSRVVDQLNRFRKINNCNLFARVFSHNSFPTGTGIASSASAFCALTLALIEAFQMKISKKEQSVLTRLAGSGSATRSVYGGFVQWTANPESTDSYATQLYDENYWDLVDVILVVSSEEKKHSTLFGHSIIQTSPFFQARREQVENLNKGIKAALQKKQLDFLGELVEKEMFAFHSIAMTSEPSLLYWTDSTVKIMHDLRAIRENGIQAYMTLDAGPNPHLITTADQADKIVSHFEKITDVKKIFKCPVGEGAKTTNDHLF